MEALLRSALAEILVRCRSAGRTITLARVTREVALAWQESGEVSIHPPVPFPLEKSAEFVTDVRYRYLNKVVTDLAIYTNYKASYM